MSHGLEVKLAVLKFYKVDSNDKAVTSGHPRRLMWHKKKTSGHSMYIILIYIYIVSFLPLGILQSLCSVHAETNQTDPVLHTVIVRLDQVCLKIQSVQLKQTWCQWFHHWQCIGQQKCMMYNGVSHHCIQLRRIHLCNRCFEFATLISALKTRMIV